MVNSIAPIQLVDFYQMGVCVFESADFSFDFLLELVDCFIAGDRNGKGILLTGDMSTESDEACWHFALEEKVWSRYKANERLNENPI